MSDRRPSRIRKPVNYTGLEDTSDDDFANNTPPPSKKPKAEKKETKSKISKAGEKDSFSDTNISTAILDSGKKRRLPVSEKIYERELQEALQISLFETGGSQDVVVHNEDHGSSSSRQADKLKTSNDYVQEAVCPSKNQPEKESEKKTTRTKQKHASGIVGTVMDDSIEVLGSLVDNDNSNLQAMVKVTPATRKTQKKNPKSDDEGEEDSDLDLNDERDDDENSSSEVSSEGNDSDFDDKPKKKRQANKKTKSSPPKILKTKSNSKPLMETSKNLITNQPKADLRNDITSSSISKPPDQSTVRISSETVRLPVKKNTSRSPSTPLTSLKTSPSTSPSWKPPSRASSGSSSLSTVKSPTTGLRLGLSRNQMTKPLHKSFKVAI